MLTIPFGSYSIYLAQHLLQTEMVSNLCTPLRMRLAIITDSNLADTYGQALQQALNQQGCVADLFVFSAGEQHKTRHTKGVTLVFWRWAVDWSLIWLGF